jgi:hypothetical protein
VLSWNVGVNVFIDLTTFDKIVVKDRSIIDYLNDNITDTTDENYTPNYSEKLKLEEVSVGSFSFHSLGYVRLPRLG